jgi:hypothetical protein
MTVDDRVVDTLTYGDQLHFRQPGKSEVLWLKFLAGTSLDWFDTCKCSIPCPCTFAQPPTTGDCEGILAWHIRNGNYGDVRLDGLSVMALGSFTGNIWEGRTKASMAIFIDKRADEPQREALQMIFGGRVGGWPGTFANFIGEVRGIEFARIDFHVDDDLASWRAEIPAVDVECRSARRAYNAARGSGSRYTTQAVPKQVPVVWRPTGVHRGQG